MEIDWSGIPLTYQWAARDSNGALWAFVGRPLYLTPTKTWVAIENISDPIYINTGAPGGADAIYHRGVDSAFQLKAAVENAEYQQGVKAAEPAEWPMFGGLVENVNTNPEAKSAAEIAAMFEAVKYDQERAIDVVQFGPRPDKLWVGMKAKQRNENIVTLKGIDETAAECAKLQWGNGYKTSMLQQ